MTTNETHPCLFDHIFNLLNGCVPGIASKIKKNAEGSDLSTSLG